MVCVPTPATVGSKVSEGAVGRGKRAKELGSRHQSGGGHGGGEGVGWGRGGRRGVGWLRGNE